MAQLPLQIKLNQIHLDGFTNDSFGGTSNITTYDGNPLFCHADENPPGSGKIEVLFDFFAPSTYTKTPGTISSITVLGTLDGTQKLTFTPIGAQYKGARIGYSLALASDLSSATLVLEQPADKYVNTNDGQLGLVILGSKVTADGSVRGYFVDVPLGKKYLDFDAMTIYYGNGGSLAGPIGSGVVPPSGP
ncbi:MAG: hypothetical protein JO036_17550 [Candidatus Eremiobacteraeota bacterium]|nr:hypothetical protein [Candidatus Eremiobacteraeota bacterium]